MQTYCPAAVVSGLPPEHGERMRLMELHAKNTLDHHLKNKMDCNIFSFNGCPDEYVEHVTENFLKPNYKNVEVLRYDGTLPYTETFRQSLNWVKENGFTDFMFFQDDGFTVAPKPILDSVFDLYDSNNITMLHLDNQDKQYLETCDKDKVLIGNGVKLYYSNTQRWVDKGLPHFGDSPYLANVDVLLNELYLEGYFQAGTVHNGENWFSQRAWEKPMDRWQVDIHISGNINFIGPCSSDANFLKEKLVKII
jgi:hypothetical protein